MAEELLPRLFSQGRRARQPRIQYQPFGGFGGPDPGMRGLMPANALDTQAMTDRAQGIDISSIEPTRLQAGQIDPAAYQGGEGQEAEDEEGGGTPVRQASMIREVGCPGGVCPTDGGMPMGMQMAMPQGVTLGPGETLVPGSVRESAPRSMAAQAPAATAAPAAQSQAAQAPGQFDPSWLFSMAQQADQTARSSLAANSPFGVSYGLKAFSQSAALGMQALEMNMTKELAENYQKLADRGIKLKTGELRWEVQDQIRTNRNIPVDDRVDQIVSMEVAYRSGAGINYKPDAIDQLRAWERAKITASDVGAFMKDYVRLTAMPEEKRYKGWEQDVSLLEGRMGELLNQEYGGLDPEVAWKRMSGELGQVYESAYGDFYKSAGMEDPSPAAKASALEAISVQHKNLQAPAYNSLRQQYSAPAQDEPAADDAPASVGYPIYGGAR